MGQKTNPNIFQLGKTKIWTSKFIEKKSLDISKYSFKNIELNKFIFKFFKDYKLQVFSCKIFYTEDTLSIFVSYLANFESTKISHLSDKKKFLVNKNLKKKIHLAPKKVFLFKKNQLFSNFFKKSIKNKNIFFKIKKYTRKRNVNYEKTICKFEKTWLSKKTKIRTFDFLLKNSFLNKLLENIKRFFIKKPKIVLNFYQLNSFAKKNYPKKQIEFIKKNLSKLRQFNENSYLKEGLQVIILILKFNNSADFLANYLSKELQKHKKQHFFLNFIQKTFEIFNKEEFCTPKNIKIQVKGRFNGAPRSKKRILIIGKPISVIKLDTQVYYSRTTSFSSNGTFGIKVWISETNDVNKNKNDTRTKKPKI